MSLKLTLETFGLRRKRLLQYLRHIVESVEKYQSFTYSAFFQRLHCSSPYWRALLSSSHSWAFFLLFLFLPLFLLFSLASLYLFDLLLFLGRLAMDGDVVFHLLVEVDLGSLVACLIGRLFLIRLGLPLLRNNLSDLHNLYTRVLSDD